MNENLKFRNIETVGSVATARIDALSDGVFAIAMTLLVFELDPPHEHGPDSETALVSGLVAMWPQFVSYAISFAALGIYWVGHHFMSNFIRQADRAYMWLNICFLMCVGVIPFSTALLGEYPTSPTSIFVYGGNLILVGVAGYVMWSYATYNHRLVSEELDPALILATRRRILIAPAVATLSILVSFISPELSLAAYAFLGLVYAFPVRMHRRYAASARR